MPSKQRCCLLWFHVNKQSQNTSGQWGYFSFLVWNYSSFCHTPNTFSTPKTYLADQSVATTNWSVCDHYNWHVYIENRNARPEHAFIVYVSFSPLMIFLHFPCIFFLSFSIFCLCPLSLVRCHVRVQYFHWNCSSTTANLYLIVIVCIMKYFTHFAWIQKASRSQWLGVDGFEGKFNGALICETVIWMIDDENVSKCRFPIEALATVVTSQLCIPRRHFD